MNHRPLSVTLTYGFIILNIIIWFALGVIIAFDLHPAMPNQSFFKGIMATLSFVASGALWVTRSDGSANAALVSERAAWEPGPSWAPGGDRFAAAIEDGVTGPRLVLVTVAAVDTRPMTP